jgi:translation initiation factor IF-3
LRNQGLNIRINNEIKSEEVRVIDETGKQLGVMKLSSALDKARELGVDLVEVSPQAVPPVVKLVEFGKFRYQEEKKRRKEKKFSKPAELKEIRFTPFIAEHDFQNRIARINEFLQNRHKVRLSVVFMGRQMGSKNAGYDLLNRIVKLMEDKIVIDSEPKFLGRTLSMTISPTSKIIKDSKQTAV